MATSNPSAIKPRVELTHTPLKSLAPTQLMTINGSLYWVTVVSKTAAGKEEFHHLDQERWKALTTPIQRIFLANVQSKPDHKATPLIDKHPQLIEIPVSSVDAPIRYEKDDQEHSLSRSEMQSLAAFKGHDLMKELRQTLRGYPVAPYLSEDQNRATALRLEALAKEYPSKHSLIHSLHTEMEKDLDVTHFDFYRKELEEIYQTHTLPISSAADFDLTQLNVTEPLFIPLKAHSISHSIKQKIKREPPAFSKDPHLLGVFFDPANHEVLIYDPNGEKKGTAYYPELEKILAHLKKQDPELSVTYQGSKETKKAQVNRRLLLFFHTMLKAKNHAIPSARLPQRIQTWVEEQRLPGKVNAKLSSTRKANALKALHQRLPSSLDERCQTLAKEVQTRYNRLHETVRVLGA